MNLLITGANGFVGKALTARLRDEPSTLPLTLRSNHVTLLDLSVDAPASDRVRCLPGSISDERVLSQAFDRPFDVIFHLASIPGGLAERQFELGRQVNLDATVALLEAASRSRADLLPPVFVFASSIAVLGEDLPGTVDDSTPPRPHMTYGAHKLIGEILVEDSNRRGMVLGRSLRLPGIVARPPQPTGQLSAFMSDIIRALASGRSYECPVAAHSTTWLMSVRCVVDNLIHAATLDQNHCTKTRTWTLPALRASMAELVDAIALIHGPEVLGRVTFRSNPGLEASFGRYPPLRTPASESAGFRHDGDLQTLVRRALEPA
jgi:nucleoside-diphosphate-sugar epimerase